MKRNDADWRGSIKRRFRWLRLRFEWGRWCYQTNAYGDEKECWWEWENA